MSNTINTHFLLWVVVSLVVQIASGMICVSVWVTSRLRSGNTDIVIKTLLTFKDTIPPPECLRVVGLLLISDDTELRNTTGNHIKQYSYAVPKLC